MPASWTRPALAGLLTVWLGTAAHAQSGVGAPLADSLMQTVERLEQTSPTGRSSPQERQMAADFLLAELGRRGLDGTFRPYRAPNVHPVLDLLVGPFRGRNVLAEIPATRPGGAVILLGAHYDSEAGSPGADDNASGVAAILAIAERVLAEPNRHHPVLIAFFDQEEEGKIGSAALARQLRDDGVVLHSVHTIDMAGWDADGDRAVELDAPSDAWFERFSAHAAALDMPITRVTYDSSDHVSFRDQGIEALCLGEAFRLRDSSPHRHRPGDTAATLNPDYLARNTRLVEAVILELVRGDAS